MQNVTGVVFMSNKELLQVELSIEANKKLIQLSNALERLLYNPDFNKVVMDGYFTDEAVRLVHQKAEPHAQNELIQKRILLQLDAIGLFKQYLNTLQESADMAHKFLASEEATRDELTREAL